MLELFLPIDEKRHNSFIPHRQDDQLDRLEILACQNEFSKKKAINHTKVWPKTKI